MAALGALAMVAVPDPAGAASSVTSGWWSVSPVHAAPDVTDDELLVQGGPDEGSPIAYAGVSFALDGGEVPARLVLQVAPGTATTPNASLSLCRLGGPADSTDAPGFDCATRVEAAPAADGASYEFDASGFAGGGSLDLAVVPTQPTDRVVLRKPAPDALQGDGTTTGGADAVPADGGFSGGSAGFADSGTPAGGVSFGAPAFDAPVTPAPAAAPGNVEPVTRLAVPAAATGPAGGADKSGRSPAPFAFFGLAAVAAALWTVAGREPGTLEDGTEPV